MTSQEYLRRPEALRLEICRKQARIRTLRRLSSRVNAVYSDVKVLSSPDHTRVQAFLAEAADEEKEIERLTEERKRAVEDAALLISRLADERMVRILEMRYLDNRSWEDITYSLGGGVSTVYRLHRQALELLSPPE